MEVIDGSVMFGLGGREPVLLKPREAFHEPPASFVAFFVLGDGEHPTVEDA